MGNEVEVPKHEDGHYAEPGDGLWESVCHVDDGMQHDDNMNGDHTEDDMHEGEQMRAKCIDDAGNEVEVPKHEDGAYALPGDGLWESVCVEGLDMHNDDNMMVRK